MNLHTDLINGVVPVSHAAAHLAQLIERAKDRRGPVVITQKGKATAVILDIATYVDLLAAIAAARDNGAAMSGEQHPRIS